MAVLAGNYSIAVTIEYIRRKLPCEILERGGSAMFPVPTGWASYIAKPGTSESKPSAWVPVLWTGHETKVEVINRLTAACKEL